ncbi:MAG: ABC transporter substrate-binding protein [Nitrosarchaeum sp.]
MKKIRLLSVVFSLIIITGVSAGNVAFADSDENTLEDRLENFCNMTNEEKRQFFADHPRIAQFKDRLANFCELSEDEREVAIEVFIEKYIPEARDNESYDLDDILDRYCEMSDADKKDFISTHDKSYDHVAKMNAYCELDEDQRDAYIVEHKDEYKKYHEKDIRTQLDLYCKMTDEDKKAFLAKHDKVDYIKTMYKYCTLDENGKMSFIKEHIYQMKDKMMDKDNRPHMDYEKLCTLSESDRAKEIIDSKKLDKISKWCVMTPEEREVYKRETYGEMKDKIMDKVHDKMKMSDMSPRLKSMMTAKYDITDERLDEIKLKYKEKFGDLSDEKRSELKMKFENHMATIKTKMSDERKSAIHDRLADMKAFKSELRERSSELTDEEKQQLRADFIQKAKDMQLAWISPRVQMNAGIDVQEIECREGFSLVMKASNGVPMCLKSNTALKLIEKGIAVPAN